MKFNANNVVINSLIIMILNATYSWAASDIGINIDGVNRTLMETLRQIKTLQQEVQELRGEVELHSHLLNTLKNKQQEIMQNLEYRPEPRATTIPNQSVPPLINSGTFDTPNVPNSIAPIAPIPPVSQPSRPPVAPQIQSSPNVSSISNGAEQKAYDNALNLLRSGSYDDAIKSFRSFIDEYPKGQLTSTSQYWIAEAYYVTRRFKDALPEFKRVIDDYPDSSKVPDSLLKLGYIQYELNQTAEAKKYFEDIINRFPQSNAAKLAEGRLAKIKR